MSLLRYKKLLWQQGRVGGREKGRAEIKGRP